ncbi:MAG: hypothetical protein ACTHU1_08845 [Arachnia sp.]
MMLDLENSYTAIRHAVGVYRRGTSVLRVEGPERQALVDHLLAKTIEFAPSNSCVDSLVLDHNGRPLGVVLAVLLEESILLIVDVAEEWLTLATEEAKRFNATLQEDPAQAIAVEGPRSWEVIEPLLGGGNIADVLLGEVTVGSYDNTALMLARVGITAEFGYVVIADDPTLQQSLAEAAEGLGGGRIDPESLERICVETNYPVLPAQLDGMNPLEGGLGWLMTFGDERHFVGDTIVGLEAPTRRTVVAWTETDCAAGAEVFDGDTLVGRVSVAPNRCGQAMGLVLLFLDDPYGVPGLELAVAGSPVRTVSRPAVDPASWEATIGVR